MIRRRPAAGVAVALALAGAALALWMNSGGDGEPDEPLDSKDRMLGVAFLSADEPVRWTPLQPGGQTPERVVLLVHGLDEPGSIWDDLAPALRDAGHVVARFDYPNDQRVPPSTDLLAASLADLRRRGTARIDLVCHSMGGLVARDVLTREGYYAGDTSEHTEPNAWTGPGVDHLILLGTPSQGSAWARLRAIAELRERLSRYAHSRDLDELLEWQTDGQGGAGDDLLPGSPFLTDLNARPLPSPVAITIIAGGMTPVNDSALQELADNKLIRSLAGEQADRLLDAIVDLSTELGDGVVPLDSTRVEGVEDFVQVEANHRSMVKRPVVEHRAREMVGAEPPVAPAIPIVLERLARAPGTPDGGEPDS
jgi:pimeloyl-ACP methyl ester carboxylesterase